MCRGPFSVVVFIAFLGGSSFVLANNEAASRSEVSPAVSAKGSSGIDHTNTDKITRATTVLTSGKNSPSDLLLPSAYRDSDRIETKPSADPVASQTPKIDSEWRFLASMLGTLAILVTIAIRRRKPGKPWA